MPFISNGFAHQSKREGKKSFLITILISVTKTSHLKLVSITSTCRN